jgi:hypothetical protein
MSMSSNGRRHIVEGSATETKVVAGEGEEEESRSINLTKSRVNLGRFISWDSDQNQTSLRPFNIICEGF